MGIFSRLAQLIKSNLNDLISNSEDPEKMLNQVVLDMNNQLVEAKKQVAASIADEKRLAKQAEQEAANAAEWERRAMMALRAGNEELAKEALARKKEHDTLAQTFKDQWTKQKAAVDQLKRALRMLNDKIEEAKRKKNILVARKKRAEAQQQIANTMQGLGDTSAFDTFDRMAERIQLMEAEAEGQVRKTAGRVLMATVKGDVHDIGKNLVNIMFEGAGFEVIDLGVQVAPEKFIEAIKEHKPDIVGFSAFLTTTMPMFKANINALQKSGLRDQVIVMVGGAPVTQEYADVVGADGYASDASAAVVRAKELIARRRATASV